MSDMIRWELQYLAVVVTVGVLLAFVYDCLRIYRRVIKHGTVWIAFEDIVFWMCAGVVTFVVCFMEDAGNVRWFAIAGEILGAVMYHILISKYYVKYTALIINFPFKLLKKLIKSFKINKVED